MSIKYCKKCLFPNTKPDLYFNDEDICDACLSADQKHSRNLLDSDENINWDNRKKELDKILFEKKKHNGGLYDCVIPVSGGKDSTWQVYVAKNILKLTPLAVTFDQFDQTDTGIHNLKILREIGVDHIHITINPKIIKKLVKKGLELIGDPYWVNHVGMFTAPINIATKFQIPIVMYGENPQFEYGGPKENRHQMIMDKRWRQEFSGMRGLREEDMIDEEISDTNLALLSYPNDKEIENSNVSAFFLGYFMKWDPKEHTEFVKTLGWKPLQNPPEGSWSNNENCDMKFIDIRERIKYLKYGYGRATDQLNIQIRAGQIKRKEALEIVKKIDGNISETNLKEFAEYIGLTVGKLEQTINSFVNSDIFEKDDNGEYKEIVERH